ncbi:Protein of unknown function [Pyronema omphalodes CBS 100304]|uniref:Uncharacterized protein n=1 Tax=Pyronema omphalodes (strain CBS 100304) TaxID=1076935 RepID=U4KUH9_PYROM|nr:Protein of unknown function [Pyronema omphalodes CBS 100304]
MSRSECRNNHQDRDGSSTTSGVYSPYNTPLLENERRMPDGTIVAAICDIAPPGETQQVGEQDPGCDVQRRADERRQRRAAQSGYYEDAHDNTVAYPAAQQHAQHQQYQQAPAQYAQQPDCRAEGTYGQHGQHVVSQSTERADRWGQIFSASTPIDGTFSATDVGDRSTAREPHDTDLPDATRRHRHSVRNLEDTPRAAQYDLIARSGHPSRRIQSEEEEGGYNPYVQKDLGAQIIKHKSSRREGRRGSRERDALRR